MIFRRMGAWCVTALVLATTACSGSSDSLCERALSLPSFTTRFSSGLDNFSDDQYEQLRLDSLDTRDVLRLVIEQNKDITAATELIGLVDDFISAMDSSDWDVSIALLNKRAVDSALVLGSASTLALANEVDVYVISQCGLPSTLAPVGPTPETLPSPSIPSPLQTDPPATPPNQESEDRELGRTVSTLFGLSLNEADMLCLGSALQGVFDATSGDSDLGQYQRQFQKAFDGCSIDFEVPGD